ncbi:DUF6527 family protein [Bradyrhizobium sp. JYMT SZCCT0428]|nr:DUF6527 family protein [Bradyrhizobium sp. JYMT SZCCT0428]
MHCRARSRCDIHLSVWRQKDCKSHFWFRHGRVKWCRDVIR